MRTAAGLSATALALLALTHAHAPALAQDDGTGSQELSEEMAEAMVESVEETVEQSGEETVEEAGEPAPVLTYIVAAPARFLEAYGGAEWLDAATEICLEEGEVVELARPSARIAAMELRGELCTTVADAPDAATVLIEAPAPDRRVRTAATRGVGATSRNRPAFFRVASGSEAVLERYPRGSRVTEQSEICLARGQQVTLISSAGQRVTYRGPGCARRNAEPSGRNVGGFTFGWNGWGVPSAGERL